MGGKSEVVSISSVGSFVRTRRKANDLTQQQLAELAGVGTRLVSELERGKPTLRMDAVNRVLNVFGQRLGYVPAQRDTVQVQQDENDGEYK